MGISFLRGNVIVTCAGVTVWTVNDMGKNKLSVQKEGEIHHSRVVAIGPDGTVLTAKDLEDLKKNRDRTDFSNPNTPRSGEYTK